MPFLDINTLFRESIADDINLFDNLEELIIHHHADDPTVDWDAGTSVRTITHTTVLNCLFRQPSQRNGGSIPLLHERSQAVQKDDFSKFDVVVEVPKLDGLLIDERDIVERTKDGKRWRVVMLDESTLSTRYRLGCSKEA
jgi:hypothetical protein